MARGSTVVVLSVNEIDEKMLQLTQFNKYLMDPESGLYFHGWCNQQAGK